MKQVAELIKKAKSAVILPHLNADGDAIGSSQAMREMLTHLGIKSRILTEEPVEKRLEFIGEGIEVYEEQVCEFDLCIVLDCGDKDRLGKRIALMEKAPVVVNIDHHKTNDGFGDASYVEADASATGEIMFGLSKELGISLDRQLARYIYSAIVSDTGGFAYSNVSAKTFAIAAELVAYDINHAEISRLMFDTVDIDEEQMKAELVNKIKSHCNGKVRTVAVTKELCDKYNVNIEELEGVVDIPRRIRGTEIAVALKEKNDCIRVSLRSNEYADVSKIAQKFDGGGHTRAAGCSIKRTIEEAEILVVKACEEIL